MPVSYQTVFGLRPDFTHEELEHAYDSKVQQIKNELKNEIDRELMFERINRFYHEAKRDLRYSQIYEENEFFPTIFPVLRSFSSDFFRIPEVNSNHIYSSSSVYNEKTLPDGSKIVVQKKSKNQNGSVEETTNSYKRTKDGNTEPIEYDEALKLINPNGLRRLQ